ncbi:MAG: DUF401 family protein [Desulfurococcales archaeon]|nr:DUF401 family protein [Desulfurococcales archaeon]
MILVYALLGSTPAEWSDAFNRLLSWNDIRVFIYIFLSLTLAGLMREKGYLDELVKSTGALGCKFSVTSVPALIGLIPMPGGALVSAIALKKRFFEEARLNPDDATYINYWFRHLWVPSWPLFQSVVITASVFALDPLQIVSHTWPGTVAAIAGGLIVSYPVLKALRCPSPNKRGAAAAFAKSIWPLLLLAALFLFSRLRADVVARMPYVGREPLLVSLALVISLFALATRPGVRDWQGALRLATKPTIHAVLLESLIFKDLILAGSAAESVSRLTASGLIPVLAVILIVPFILGLAAGGENFFASTAMPLLAPYIASSAMNWKLLTLAYLSGYLGVMASPVHLCLVLTVEYYRADMGRVLAKVIVTVAVAFLLGALLIEGLY